MRWYILWKRVWFKIWSIVSTNVYHFPIIPKRSQTIIIWRAYMYVCLYICTLIHSTSYLIISIQINQTIYLIQQALLGNFVPESLHHWGFIDEQVSFWTPAVCLAMAQSLPLCVRSCLSLKLKENKKMVSRASLYQVWWKNASLQSWQCVRNFNEIE